MANRYPFGQCGSKEHRFAREHAAGPLQVPTLLDDGEAALFRLIVPVWVDGLGRVVLVFVVLADIVRLVRAVGLPGRGLAP